MPERSPPTSAPAPLAEAEHPSRAAAAFAGALAKAARALPLYDPANALVSRFLADVRARAAEATAHGPLDLDVGPAELAVGGEAVYRDDDPDRSLPLRLFRDGIRRMSFSRDVLGQDVLRVVEVLAVRLAGVRQAEDDAVTLLRAAELRTVAIVAVEGYAPEEDVGGAAGGVAAVRAIPGARAPASYDRPFPRLPPPGPLAYAPVPEGALAPLREAEAPEALPARALELVAEILACAAPGEVSAAEAAGLVAEVRAFLAAEGRLGELVALADSARALPPGAVRDAVLPVLPDPRLVDAALAAFPAGATELPPAAARLLPLVPAGAVLDRLADEAGEARRAALVALAAARLPDDVDAVLSRLARLPAGPALRLAREVAARAPARGDAAAVALLDHHDPAVQVDGLRALAEADARVPSAPVVRLLRSEVEAVRVAAAEALARHGDAATARAVAAALTERKEYSRDEADALGRALGRLHPGVADRLFEEWLPRKGGLLAALRRGGREELLRWAAVAGLGVMEGGEAERRIAEVAVDADEALRRHCHATLARRRAGDRRRG